MQQKILNYVSWAVKIGLYILPFAALIVSGNTFSKIFMPGVGDMFFPFITGKNFFFRIIVEVLLVFWGVLAVFEKKYRPKISPIFWAVLATLLVLILSTIFGENPYRSFWSNYERMEGLIGHIHLFFYFLMLISVLKTEIDWHRFFYSTIFVSFIMSIYSYLQYFGQLEIHQSNERLDATLGNATYLAIYIVFHLFLIAYFALKEEQKWLKFAFVALFLFELPIVFFTATRGAILGLLGGAVIFAGIMIWKDKRKYVRRTAIGIGCAVLLVVALFFSLRNTSFIHKNYVLKRFADISFSERTVTSRFTIWGMALDGLKENPVLGWGPENFNLLFNKYYSPTLWRQEPWFDRSHNVILDWLTTGGILGLGAYLSIFAAALYSLWKFGSNTEKAVFTSLFAAYFFHNFFVFDNLTSYFLFFSVLAYLHSKYIFAQKNTEREMAGKPINLAIGYSVSGILLVAFIFIFYFANIKPMLASRALLTALKDMSINSQNPDLILSDFDRAISYRTFGTMESREQLSGYANNIGGSNLPNEQKLKVLNRAVSEMELQVAASPKDAREIMFLSALYARIGKGQEALDTAKKALENAPQKQQIYFLTADLYIGAGQMGEALKVLQKAYDLDKTYFEAGRNLALVAILANDEPYALRILKESHGKEVIPDQQLIAAYARVGNYKRVAEIWKLIIEADPQNAQYYVNLAATYMQLNDRKSAIKELEKAIGIDPKFKEQGEYFINEIKAGRNP